MMLETRPIADRTLDEAARWFRRLEEDRSAATLADFEAWLRCDRANAAAMDRLERTWTEAGALASLPAFAPELARARRRPAAARSGFLGTPLTGRLGLAGAVAAAVLALVVGIGAHVVAVDAGLLRHESYLTASGERRDVRLPDGTLARLNAGSRMDVRYGWLSRRVALRGGEAEFDVAHGRRRPFEVDTDQMSVRATGTVFSVKAAGGASTVVLSEGGVLVTAPGDRAGHRLRPGQKATVAAGGPVRVAAADLAVERAWLSGMIVFEDATVAEALTEFERYGAGRAVADPTVARLRVSGAFAADRLDSFLAQLQQAHGVAVSRGPAGWRIAAGRRGEENSGPAPGI